MEGGDILESLTFTNHHVGIKRKLGIVRFIGSIILLLCCLLTLIILFMDGFDLATFLGFVLFLISFLAIKNNSIYVDSACIFSISSEKILIDYPNILINKKGKKIHITYNIPINTIDFINFYNNNVTISGKAEITTEVDGEKNISNSIDNFTLFYPDIPQIKNLISKYISDKIISE